MSHSPTRTRYRKGLAEIVDEYDAFILDQWGVIHDGISPYAMAVEAMEMLQQHARTVIILTNSAKSAARNAERLRTLGVAPSLYQGLVSSADVLKQQLLKRSAPGQRVFLVAAAEDRNFFDDCAISITDDIRDASCVVLLSVEGSADPGSHASWIEAGAKRGLDVYTPSADLRSVTRLGVVTGLRALVDAYINLDGRVTLVGKPERVVYDLCFDLLAGTPREKIVALGDQVWTDVVGAQRAGIASALVATGAAEPFFAECKSEAEWVIAAEALGVESDTKADWVLPSLRP